jgi:hypothetical protein
LTGTFSGVEDCDGPVPVGDAVAAVWEGTPLETSATVVEVDDERHLVFLNVDWAGIREA